MTLVTGPGAMADTLRRLHAHNDSVMFYNQSQSMKLMLRNDPIDADTIGCELALVLDEDDDGAATVLDLLTDGYVEDPSTYVLESWSFPKDRFGEEEAAKVMHVINRVYLYRMCGCRKYVIRDDAAMCLFCHMTATPESGITHYCPICCEEGVVMHMAHMDCCQQQLHTHCLKTWRAKSGDGRCPLCRQ